MSVRAMRRKVKEEEEQGGAFDAQCMVWRMADGVWADSVYGCGPVERGLDSPLGWPGAGAGAGAGGEGRNERERCFLFPGESEIIPPRAQGARPSPPWCLGQFPSSPSLAVVVLVAS